MLMGKLTYISSDTLVEQGPNGQSLSSYRAHIRIDPQQSNPMLARVALKPGMTATIDIKTRTRSVLQYLLAGYKVLSPVRSTSAEDRSPRSCTMHIGILEDDEVLAHHLASVLQSAGHTSAVFNSARTFLPALNRNTFDLLVFDWRLPDQDGVKVLKHVRASLHGETPVIFLTAVHDEQAIVTALEAGADDYCVKPLRPSEFLARVVALQRRIYPAKQMVGPQTFNGYTFDPMTRVISWEVAKRSFRAKSLSSRASSLKTRTGRFLASA